MADRAQAAGLAHAPIRLWRTTSAAACRDAALLFRAIPHRHAAFAADVASHSESAVEARGAERSVGRFKGVSFWDNHTGFEIIIRIIHAILAIVADHFRAHQHPIVARAAVAVVVAFAGYGQAVRNR